MDFQITNQNPDGGLQDYIKSKLANDKVINIKASTVNNLKSYEQIKAIHKLCTLLIPRFAESYGVPFDLDSVKTSIKLHFGFTRKATSNEILAEAINQKNQLKSIGVTTNKINFRSLLETIEKELIKPKSFAKASKEEMIEIITKVELLAQSMGWSEIKLTSLDMKSLIDSYQ